MDFLEIRRKAKERAAARAAASSRAPAAGAPEPEARSPLALEPLPIPDGGTSPPVAPSAPPEARRRGATWTPPDDEPIPEAPTPPDPEAERQAAEEAARLEAELEARLREMPAAGDGRFLTWRPSGGQPAEVPPIAPVGQGPDAAGARQSPAAGRGQRRRAGGPLEPAVEEAAPGPAADPLDEFFYRNDETGPSLGSLAAPAETQGPAPEAVERVEYLTFLLGVEEYGVEIERVREVMRSPPITEVPRAPPDVLGVITVRGEVVAVFDPRGRLGLPRDPGAQAGRVIIVDDGTGPCGLLVDGVTSVVRLPRGSIEARPQGIGGSSTDCLEGIGRDRDRLFTVLSVPALLRAGRRGEGRG